MKVWHDDIRPAPDGWVWARTNQEAKLLLADFDVTEISLDHDMGLHELTDEDVAGADRNHLRGHSPDGSGHDLVVWMVEQHCVPARVTIHSWNNAGARRMANYLMKHAGRAPMIRPFVVQGGGLDG